MSHVFVRSLSVIIPVCNEEDILLELITRLIYVLKNNVLVYECIFIDDGSCDNSLSLLYRISTQYKYVKIISHNKRYGQCKAIETGFKNAKYDYVLTMDADLQVIPEDIPLLLKLINDKINFVNAIRKKRQTSLIYILYSKILSFLISCIVNERIVDPASNFMVIKKCFLNNIKIINNDHRFLVPILLQRGAKIKEVEVSHRKRKYGESKYGISKGITAFKDFIMFYLRYINDYYK